MPLSNEEREQVANELKRFATEDLNLSSDQKEKLHGFLTEAYEKVQDYRKQNPNATREDLIRKVGEKPDGHSRAAHKVSNSRATHEVGR